MLAGVTLRVAAPGVLANDAGAAGAKAQLVEPAAHGRVRLSGDGSFSYLPDTGYHGIDGFSYLVVVAGRASAPVRVSLDVQAPQSGTSQPTGGVAGTQSGSGAAGGTGGRAPDAFVILAADAGLGGISFGSLGLIGMAFDWFVPGVAMTVPGLLLLLAIAAQALGGIAWLPTVRRRLGEFGFRGPGARPVA